MIFRVVKMTFKDDKLSDFLSFFELKKDKIAAVAGCLSLRLMQEATNPSVIITLSEWQTIDALENYRNSALFKEVWQQTKQWFASKTEAFSCLELETVKTR